MYTINILKNNKLIKSYNGLSRDFIEIFGLLKYSTNDSNKYDIHEKSDTYLVDFFDILINKENSVHINYYALYNTSKYLKSEVSFFILFDEIPKKSKFCVEKKIYSSMNKFFPESDINDYDVLPEDKNAIQYLVDKKQYINLEYLIRKICESDNFNKNFNLFKSCLLQISEEMLFIDKYPYLGFYRKLFAEKIDLSYKKINEMIDSDDYKIKLLFMSEDILKSIDIHLIKKYITNTKKINIFPDFIIDKILDTNSNDFAEILIIILKKDSVRFNENKIIKVLEKFNPNEIHNQIELETILSYIFMSREFQRIPNYFDYYIKYPTILTSTSVNKEYSLTIDENFFKNIINPYIELDNSKLKTYNFIKVNSKQKLITKNNTHIIIEQYYDDYLSEITIDEIIHSKIKNIGVRKNYLVIEPFGYLRVLDSSATFSICIKAEDLYISYFTNGISEIVYVINKNNIKRYVVKGLICQIMDLDSNLYKILCICRKYIVK